MPEFSVVIPVYNKALFLSKTITSVLKQTFEDFELVIVNDGSTDDSEQVIKKFDDPRIVYLKQENQGVSAARNKGVLKAKTKYIALLDADDYWEPNYLEEMDTLTKAHPEESIFAVSFHILERGKFKSPEYSIEDLKQHEVRTVDFFQSSFIECILTSRSTVVTKEAITVAGLYDSKIRSGEDTDVYIRLGLQHKVVFKNTVLATYVINAGSLSTKKIPFDKRLNPLKYKREASSNPAVKKYLDLNSYSLALLANRIADKKAYHSFRDSIAPENLNSKQQFLLNASPFLLNTIFKLKIFLEKIGLSL
ncbi:MAG: glycosyltransferase involved in cell wall biosynthesis, partial [Patiriisocius sp.]